MIGKRGDMYSSSLPSFCAGVIQAQVVAPNAGSENVAAGRSLFGLGVFGGPAGGLGISFRHHLPAAFSYQVTGGIINVDDKLNYDYRSRGAVRSGARPFRPLLCRRGGSYFYSGTDGVNEMDGPGRFGLGCWRRSVCRRRVPC